MHGRAESEAAGRRYCRRLGEGQSVGTLDAELKRRTCLLKWKAAEGEMNSFKMTALTKM